MMTKPDNTAEQQSKSNADETSELMRNRIDKIEKLANLGGHAYRNDFKPTDTTNDVKAFYHWGPSGKFDDNEEPMMQCGRPPQQGGMERFSLAGRIIFLRSFGKGAFIKIRDRHGDIQVHISKKRIGEEEFERYLLCEIGDIVGVVGGGFLTKTKELTVRADQVVMLTKAVRPLPEKWNGLRDTETRYRQRYVDLIANPHVGKVFRKRALIIKTIRNFLEDLDFLEVETPMMHPLVGGAAAKPFVTYHNTLKMELYMRIAPELYLKRLLVGGFERVFEINRNFRNEGISPRHNPEFTMIEFYMAYATFEDLISLTEQMIAKVAETVCGTTTVNYQGTDLDFSAPWQRMTMKESIVKFWNSDWGPAHNAEEISLEQLGHPEAVDTLLQTHFKSASEDENGMEYGEQIGFLFEAIAEEKLIQPTFITDFPRAISPLARCNESDPEVVDRFEVFVYGRELGNAFSELNDPFDQRERFQRQVDKKTEGAEETMDYDEDYIRALEHGMPPAAGEGIGIDRLCMFLCDAASIRDVILFPQLKKQSS